MDSFNIMENDNTLKISGLFMKSGLSRNNVYYTEAAVQDMVRQINEHAQAVLEGVDGAQYVTMNFSHFTDEINGTVARVISAHYEPKEDGGEAYFDAELMLDLPQAQTVKTLLQNNALGHVSIYGFVDSPDDIEAVFDEDDFKYYKVHKLSLERIDFTKTPGVVDAKVKIAASKTNNISIVNDVLVANNLNLGGTMKKTEVENKTQAILLQEEVEKKQAELTEAKAKMTELQEKIEKLEAVVKEEQEIVKKAYSKIDTYMKEAYLEELKATKGWSDKIINDVLSELMEKETFSSKELDTDKRYVEFKEFYKPTVETVEKIIANTKEILETVNKKDDSEEKPEVKETKENPIDVSDIISNLL